MPRPDGHEVNTPTYRHHTNLGRARRFGAIIAALLYLLGAGSLAKADPSVSQIEAQIADAWGQAEQLIEEYNLVHAAYQRNLARQADLLAKIAPLQREIDLVATKVGWMASRAYESGGVTQINAMMLADSPSDLVDRLTFLDQMARDQARQVRGATELKRRYDEQKAPIDDLVATLASQDADLAARHNQIETRLTDLQAMRRRAYATSGTTGSFRPWTCPVSYEPTNGYKAALFACLQAGKPYVWAAAGPGSYDCSGLVLAAWARVGVYLPHQSREQRASIRYITRSELRIGDLVFYFHPIHHVAIYVGDNKIMQAPTAGDYVRMTDINYPGTINSYGRPG